MTVNQAQVDHIIATASADDPEVKLQRLADEVDLIKTSIKRLLIDIRERMNEIESPFVAVARGGQRSQESREEQKVSEEPKKEKALPEAEEQSPPKEEKAKKGDRAKIEEDSPVTADEEAGRPPVDIQRFIDEINARARERRKDELETNGKSKLRTVHRLFDWASKMVKKYGHDRFELMLNSYRVMGYLTESQLLQIKEMSRLMPASLGDLQEIGADEFIFELYTMNRILDPMDTSLDRDMLEVMMEQRKQKLAQQQGETGEQLLEENWLRIKENM